MEIFTIGEMKKFLNNLEDDTEIKIRIEEKAYRIKGSTVVDVLPATNSNTEQKTKVSIELSPCTSKHQTEAGGSLT